MDLPPPQVFTTYADVTFHPNATLPNYPQRRGESAPSAAEIERASKVYPEDPIKALENEAAVVNWGTSPRSPNYCPATREAPPIMPVFGNDRTAGTLGWYACIKSLQDVPPVINRTAEQALFTTVWAATAPLGVAGDVLGLPVVLIRGIGNILFDNIR
jgi:hypothetical protein